jgi:hypothetical protein
MREALVKMHLLRAYAVVHLTRVQVSPFHWPAFAAGFMERTIWTPSNGRLLLDASGFCVSLRGSRSQIS